MTKIVYAIECLNRDMHVNVNAADFDKANQIIDNAYTAWCNVEENPELQYECCEEHICNELNNNGIEFEYTGSISWEEEEE